MRRIPVLFFLLLIIASAFSRCAQIVAPTGGPRDSLPPILVSSIPPDSSLNFKNKKITLTFNEFVQLQNLQKEMIITPYPKRQPQITARLRTVNIEINDTLQPNTTYTFNLGNAIEDINEGNPLKDFQYVFSTGDYLDSLQISGTIYDAETGIADSTAAILLYSGLEDSVVSKEKPVYYGRSSSGGKFRLGNLPHGTFKLFALQDVNGDLQYTDSTEAIAFISDSMRLDSNFQNLHLYLFKEKEAITPPDTSAAAKKDTLTFSIVQESGKQDLHSPLSIQFSRPLATFDSVGIQLKEDTLLKIVQPVFTLDSTKKNLKLAYNWKESMPYRLLLPAGFATDTGGLKSPKADTISFMTKSASDYGSLLLHFTSFDSSGHYILQVVQNDKMVASAPLTGRDGKIDNLQPGDYEVRLLMDANGNGVWDRGRYYGEKRPPEIVIPVMLKFTVRANWDNDYPDIKLPSPGDPQIPDTTRENK